MELMPDPLPHPLVLPVFGNEKPGPIISRLLFSTTQPVSWLHRTPSPQGPGHCQAVFPLAGEHASAFPELTL